MDINKLKNKGIMFTLISILLAGLFISMFSMDIKFSKEEKIPATSLRIQAIDTHVKNFEKYVSNAVEISAYTALDSVVNFSVSRAAFFSDQNEFNKVFYSCFQCGLTNCTSGGSQCPNMNQKDINYLLSRIVNMSKNNMNIDTAFTINSFNISQQYPFEVQVSMNISYLAWDNLSINYARWNRTLIITKNIPIVGLLDPSLSINSKGSYYKIINPYLNCTYSEPCWNINTAKEFYNTNTFRYLDNGTSYLQRFWNSSSPSSCCGIESFINTSLGNGAPNTFVDTYYWNRTYYCDGTLTDVKILRIDNIAAGFNIDEITAARYNIASYGVVVCP